MSFDVRLLFRKRVIVLFLFLTLMVVVLEIWAVNRLSTYGEQTSRLEKTKNTLRIENQLLKNRIDKATSLIKTEQQAQKFGFEKVKNILYIR